MYLLLLVLVYLSRETKQNFLTPFYISIIFFLSLFIVWESVLIITVMQETSDTLSKLQTVTLFRPIRSLQCS